MSDHPREDAPETATSGSSEPDGEVGGGPSKKGGAKNAGAKKGSAKKDEPKPTSSKDSKSAKGKGAPRPEPKPKAAKPKAEPVDDEQDPAADGESPQPAEAEERSDEASPKPRRTDSEPPALEAAEMSGDLTLDEVAGSEKTARDEVAEADSSEPPEAVAAGPIDCKVFGRADVGQIREHNEDNFLIADLTAKLRGVAGPAKTIRINDGGVLLVVCDGMGGAAAGEVASQMATDVVYDQMLAKAGHQDRDQLALNVVEALEIAGAQILHEASTNRACRGMGTTATVAALVDEVLLLGQVGDSRGYILRGDRLVQVTRDQSLVNQLVEAGQLTEEEAENFEHSNIILQALGTAETVQVDLTFATLRRGDVLMLCSDGLSGMIRDNEIAETMTNVPDPVEACRVLIDDANEAGGHDNITVIVAVFDGEGLKEATLDDVESLKYQKYAVPAWAGSAADDTRPLARYDDSLEYDSTPSIEITGEFEIDENVDWDDVLDDRPDIPKEAGLNASSVIFWIALVGVVIVLYFLLF